MAKQTTDFDLLGGLFGSQVAAEIEAENALKQARQEAEREARRDRVAERLIADGFFANEFQLESDGSFNASRLRAEYAFPFNLPSRMFMFPLKTLRGPNGVRRIAMRHPRLTEHPMVKKVLEKGYEICSADECVNGYGTSMSFFEHGTWWHAVDLIFDHPQQLLDTRDFTTDADILAAVAYCCHYPHQAKVETVAREMRGVMAGLNAVEPEESESVVRTLFAAPRTNDLRAHINCAIKSEHSAALAWAYIHGIENGWFASKGGFLQFSRKRLEKFICEEVLPPEASVAI